MEVRDETYKHHRNEEELGIKTSGKVHRSKNKKTLEEELKVRLGEDGYLLAVFKVTH